MGLFDSALNIATLGTLGGTGLGQLAALNGGKGNPLTGLGLFGTDKGVIDTTGSTSPWGPIQPYLRDLFKESANLYGQNLFQPSQNTLAASQNYAATANDPNSLTNQSRAQTAATIRGDYLDPSTNPYLQNAVQQALGQAGSTFASQYGGNAGTNLSNSGYQESLAKNLGQTAIPFYANAYQQERQNQLNAMGMSPSLDYANAGALAQAGQMDQAAMQMPWQNLGAFQQSLFGGLPAFNQTTGQTPYFQNNTANTLGAIAGIGGLAKAFSDRRLKSEIVKIGEDPRGFGLYEFTILGERRFGVMADEVEKIMPEAVSDFLGYRQVDYGRLGYGMV